MKKFISLLIISMLFLSKVSTIYAQPSVDIREQDSIDTKDPNIWSKDFPSISSESAIVMEAETGSILYNKDMHMKNYPASITKILTALIALENSTMNEIVTFSRDSVFEVELNSSRIGIDVGEELTMEQALHGILLASANEVTYAVAEHIGGDIPSFSKLMNDKAKDLGALNSNFANPHGLPDTNHYTSAYDMAVISRAALENENFREITKTRTFVIPPTNIQTEARPLANHHNYINRNIHFEGAIGGKTGWTKVSRYTLVTYAKRDGMTLICVIMDCPTVDQQYTDTSNLLNYAFENFNLTNIDESNIDTSDNMDFFAKYPSFFNLSTSPLELSENGKIVLPNDVDLGETERETKLVPIEQLKAGENIIGSIIYSYNDAKIGRTDIIYNNMGSESLLKSSYLLPAKPEPNKTDISGGNKEDKKADKSYTPIIFGIIVGFIVVFIGFALIYYLNPYRRKNIKFTRRKTRKKFINKKT